MPSTIFVRVVRPAASGNGLEPVQNAHTAFVKEALLRSKPFSGTGPLPYWRFDGQYDTHKHRANGFYVLDAGTVGQSYPSGTVLDPVPGKWLLSVQAPGATPVVQRVTLKAARGVLRATPGWDDHPSDRGQSAKARTAATVDMAYFAKGANKGIPAEHTLITVVTLPRREVVFLCGVDYEVVYKGGRELPLGYSQPLPGTQFEIFAESRRADLATGDRIDSATRVTFLNARTGIRSTTVPAKGGWLTVDLESTATARADRSCIGILDLYGYLDSVGASWPGTIREVGIFSHAWVGGPILHNTDDRSGSSVERDADDHDGRPKDWNPSGVMTSFLHLKAAFSSDAILKTWGCNHPVLVRAQILAALPRLSGATTSFPRDKAFIVEVAHESHGNGLHEVEGASLDQLRYLISRYFNAPSGAWTYLGAAAHFLAIPCIGAPVGAGANYLNNRMVITSPEGDPILNYLKAEFSLPDNAILERYMDYRALKSADVTAPPFSPDRWYGSWPFSENFAGVAGSWGYVKLHNGAFAIRSGRLGVAVSWIDPPIVPGSPGVLYRFSRTTPHKICRLASNEALLLKQDQRFDSGLFVQQNGKVWVVQKVLPRGTWHVVTAEISHEQLHKEESDGPWVLVTSLPAITNGLMFSGRSAVF